MFLHQGTQVIVIVIDLKTKNKGVLQFYFSFFDDGSREINHGIGRLIMAVGHLTMADRHVKRPCGEHCTYSHSLNKYD